MKNVSTVIEGKKLIITIDMTEKHGKSKSGKTEIVATTGGNIVIDGPVKGLKLGLNAYVEV